MTALKPEEVCFGDLEARFRMMSLDERIIFFPFKDLSALDCFFQDVVFLKRRDLTGLFKSG